MRLDSVIEGLKGIPGKGNSRCEDSEVRNSMTLLGNSNNDNS